MFRQTFWWAGVLPSAGDFFVDGNSIVYAGLEIFGLNLLAREIGESGRESGIIAVDWVETRVFSIDWASGKYRYEVALISQ